MMQIIALIILFILFFEDKAFAYLDPGSGSYLFQIFLAVILSSLFAIKLFWRNILNFFKGLFKK